MYGSFRLKNGDVTEKAVFFTMDFVETTGGALSEEVYSVGCKIWEFFHLVKLKIVLSYFPLQVVEAANVRVLQ